MIVVVREQVELEVGWHPLGPDRLGFWFESAYEQARTPLAKVSERVVVAVDRQARVHAREGVGRHWWGGWVMGRAMGWVMGWAMG